MTTALLSLLLACPPAKPPPGDTATGTEDGGGGEDGGGFTPPFTMPTLTLTVHPEVSTLLVASWPQTAAVDEAWIEFSFEGQSLRTPAEPLRVGPQEQVLLGIPAATAVKARLFVVHGGETLQSEEASGTTGSLPADLVVPTLVKAATSAASPQPWALTAVDVGGYNFYGPFYVVILDRLGRVVWYESVDDSRLTWQPRPSLDGTHLVYEASTYYVFDSGVLPSIKRMTLDGAYEEETFIEGMGLAWSELSDGSFLFDHAESGYEYHLERLYPDGERDRLWSCYPWMSAYDRGYWACAPNAIVVDPVRNTALYSMFQTSTVVELDIETGERLRHFGQIADGYAFDPSTSVFDLQHYPNWTPGGTLLASTHQRGAPNRQFIREYEVDEGAQTLRMISSVELPVGYYAQYAGGAIRLANGNTMVTVGTDGAVLELDPSGEIAWELDWAGHLVGNVLLLDDLYALNQGP